MTEVKRLPPKRFSRQCRAVDTFSNSDRAHDIRHLFDEPTARTVLYCGRCGEAVPLAHALDVEQQEAV